MQTLALAALITISSGLIGGRPAGPDEFASTVFLEGNCTGTKIAPKMFLTAAHCIMDEYKKIKPVYSSRIWKNFFIRSHASHVNTLQLEKYFIHPSYIKTNAKKPGLVSYDAAILVVSNETPDIPEAKLNFDEVMTNTKVIIGGYGCEKQYQVLKPNERRYKIAEADVILTDDAEYNFISYSKNGGLCLGDSGGGVFLAGTHELVGINSLTLKRGSDRADINGHTRISRIQDWIEEILSQN